MTPLANCSGTSKWRPSFSVYAKLTISTRPIEACVILLPLFEFLHGSPLFRRVFAGTLVAAEEEKKTATRLTPLPLTLLSLSSYLLSHASSSSSPRAIAYASLAMSTLLVMVESDEIMASLRQESKEDVRLCRQVCGVSL